MSRSTPVLALTVAALAGAVAAQLLAPTPVVLQMEGAAANLRPLCSLQILEAWEL